MSTSDTSVGVDDEIRLTYVISGSIAGKSTSFETDSSQLTEHEAQELRDLITAADFFNAPPG